MAIEQVSGPVAALGECPIWDWRNSYLYWIDIGDRRVHRYEPATDTSQTRTLQGRPGAIAMTTDSDRFLVAVEHEIIELTWSTGETKSFIEFETSGTKTRLNDGRCDAAGRFWIGSMDDPSQGGPLAARLYRLDQLDSYSVIETGVGVSNGLAFTPDGAGMYWADTTRGLVWQYDYDLATGDRSNGRQFLNFADLPGRPDGACVDDSGCYWIACVYGWAILRVTPTGLIDRRIDLPIESPTMPAFGGADLSTLFVTSLSSGGSRAPALGQPLAGSLLAIDVAHRGLREPVFRGAPTAAEPSPIRPR